MDAFLSDLRYAGRMLVANPAFTAVSVLCLAIGIGVNTMLFSIVDTVSLRPFPFEDPEQLVAVDELQIKRGARSSTSWLTLEDWRRESTAFTHLAALEYRSLTLSDGVEPERFLGGLVTWNLFPMLGVDPALGRGIREDEDRPGAAGVVLLSDDIWQRRYQRDPSVLGRSVLVNDRPHTIVGVMPPRFRFPQNSYLWIPLAPSAHDEPRSQRGLSVFARLRPDVSLEEARIEMDALASRLAARYPDDLDGWGVAVRTLREEFIPSQVTLVTLTMMGAVTLVLFIACANVANLLLARASTRQREISIRAALGAGRGRIIRQLLTESVLIALVSAPLGVAIAWAGLRLLDQAIPAQNQIPWYIVWQIDGRALAYTMAVALGTGFVFGLIPALNAASPNLQESLKEGGRGTGGGSPHGRLRNLLVAGEVALAVILLIGASLFVRSFVELERANAGFATDPLMTLRIYLPGEQYEPPGAKARRVEDLIRRIEALPGVEAATASNLIPLGGGGGNSAVEVEGRTAARGEEPRTFYAGVTSGFFRTLAVPLLRGRDFTTLEGESQSQVAIVNQTLANRLWPGEPDPVGRRFRLLDDPSGHWFTVIGLTPDLKYDIDDREPTPSAYVSYHYMETPNTGFTIRVSGDPAAITTAAREQIRLADPGLPIFETQTMEAVRKLSFWEDELFGWMFGIFGAIALLLAAVGVYGVLSYSVSQRTHEIGLRLALGAGRGDVLRLIVGQGLKLAAAGILLGVVGSLGVTRVIGSVLYNVSPTDPISFVGIAIFLGLIATAASYLPARRATAVDPMVALRIE